jgi:hypothetical protein
MRERYKICVFILLVLIGCSSTSSDTIKINNDDIRSNGNISNVGSSSYSNKEIQEERRKDHQ